MKRASKHTKSLLRKFAERGVIAALPVAMVATYSLHPSVPSPPRLTAAEYELVAEISNAATTVGIAASSLSLSGLTAEQIREQLEEMQAIGVENIRIAVPWALIDIAGPLDPEDGWWGTYAWSNIETVIVEAARLDMGVLAEINATPPHAVIAGGFGTGTPSPTAFAEFLDRFINNPIVVDGQPTMTTYGDVVSAYEIWNEPNSVEFSLPVDPEAYARLLHEAYAAVKTYDSTATVVGGAVGTVQDSFFTMNTVTFVQRMVDELDRLNALPGAVQNPGFDALSVHPYSQEIPYSGSCPTCIPGLLTPREQVEIVKSLIDGRKIWITEYGLPTWDPPPVFDANGQLLYDRPEITEQQQRDWIYDLLDYWKKHPEQAGPIFLYTNRDSLTPLPGSDQGHFGLWKFDAASGEWVLKSAGEMLEEWLNAPDPPDPTDPPGPANPIEALAQFVQALVQQFTQTLQTIAQFVQTFVNTIASIFSGFGQQPAVAPQTNMLRMANVDEPEADSLDADADARVASVDAAAADATEQESVDETAVEVTEAASAEVDTSVASAPVAETASVESPAVVSEPETNETTSTPKADEESETDDAADDATADAEADEGADAEEKTDAEKAADAMKSGNKVEPTTKAGDDKAADGTPTDTTPTIATPTVTTPTDEADVSSNGADSTESTSATNEKKSE